MMDANEARERELARLNALIERWADYIMQGRDGDDAEGLTISWQNLNTYKRQRDALLAEGSGCICRDGHALDGGECEPITTEELGG